ncbi:hypothetical protein GCM10027256_37650 [Novispirillum itersonii subsp. nipponicum]
MGYAMVQQDTRRSAKSDTAFRTISEVADDLDVPQHVLRFWETKFTQIRPMKRGGGRRYYRPEDVTLLRRIRALLYDDGFTIKGVQKLLREGGVAPGEPVAAALLDAETVVAGTASVVASAPEEEAPSPAEPSLEAPEEPEQIDIFMAIERQVAAEGLQDRQRRELSAIIDELTSVQRLLSSAFS